MFGIELYVNQQLVLIFYHLVQYEMKHQQFDEHGIIIQLHDYVHIFVILDIQEY